MSLEEGYKTTTLPQQKIATGSKTKQWFINCVNAGIQSSNIASPKKGNRSYKDKKILRDLENGIVDVEDIQRIINYVPNQFGTQVLDQVQNFPLANPRINLLVGESLRRRFDYAVRVINDDSISEKESELKDIVTKELASFAMSQDYSEEKLKKKLDHLSRFEKYEYQDMRERMASNILAYLYREQECHIKFSEGIENALYIGEEIYCVDIVGKSPVARVVDPLEVSVVRSSSSSYKVEDADIIVEDRYMPIGRVIDDYYDWLTPSDINKIEKGSSESVSGNDISGHTNTRPAFQSDMFADPNNANDLIDFFSTQPKDLAYGTYDSEGNVRVSRVVWKGMRKVGILSYYDENGIRQEDMVDENYKANKDLGEKVKWVWISEWYEGTRIADDIFVKLIPRPIQFRRMDNISESASGYVGTLYPQSLMEVMKPYQYLYILVMEQLKKALRKFKAPQIELDLAKIPDEWKLEDWLYYAEEMGYLIVDSFKEGDKGEATGKLAGNFNTTGKSYNPNMGQYITQLQIILEFIERQVSIISGVSDQRLGQIENRETVGGIERSVTQSSNITEKIFALHDNTKVRVMEALLETAKYAWRNDRSKRTQYVLDDMSTSILDIDVDVFRESDYGIFVNNTSEETELISSMKQLAHAMLQNDKINVTDLMTVLTSNSIASMRRRLEASDEERREREQKNVEAQNQAQIEKIQADERNKQLELQFSREENIRDNQTKIAVEQMKQNNNNEELERDKLRLQEEKIDTEEEIKKAQLRETERHNKATERQKNN